MIWINKKKFTINHSPNHSKFLPNHMLADQKIVQKNEKNKNEAKMKEPTKDEAET